MEIVTSKAIGIQLLRHRSFTFQEFSQRYSVVDRIEPTEFRIQADKNRQSSTSFAFFIDGTNISSYPEWDDIAAGVVDCLEQTEKLYKKMIDRGIAKECARMILPMATQTTIFMTGSVRSWIHFLDLRDDSHAQLEAQLIAKEIKKIFKQELPIISEALNYETSI